MKRSRALLAVALAGLLVAACSAATAPSATGPRPSTAPAPAGETQTSEGGQVTVAATWSGPAAGAVFDVKLDTHSVDLDSLDLGDATLRNDRGETLRAIPWAAPAGGHHREGTLTFDGDGAAFLDGTAWIELALPGIGDVPVRTLRWDLGSDQ